MLKLKSKMDKTPQIIILLGSLHSFVHSILYVGLIHSSNWFIRVFHSFIRFVRFLPAFHFFILSIDSDGTNTQFVHSIPWTDWDIFKQFMTHCATQAVYRRVFGKKRNHIPLTRHHDTMIRHNDTTTNHDKYTTNRMKFHLQSSNDLPVFVWFVESIVYQR